MAETVLNLTAMDAAMKELYDGQTVQMMAYKDKPLLALMPKKTNFGGRKKPLPLMYGSSQGRSATFASARANKTAALLEQFELTRKKDYSIATIDNETMLASRTDKMAFIEGAKLYVDAAIYSISRSLSNAVYRNGTGSIAEISAISSGVITLKEAATVVHFEVNMTLQANATDGGTPRAAKGYVIAIDRGAGTVTVASSGLGGAAGSPASWAANDFILQDGDVNAKVSGVQAWIPDSAPSATLFYGVDRTADVTRLGGVRYDGSSLSIEEALIEGSSLVAREGGTTTHAFMTYATMAALEKSLGSKVQYVDLKGPAGIGFRGVRVHGANSEIICVADRDCIPKRVMLLQIDTWELASLGECPQILTYEDGLHALRVTDADEGELRVGYYANVGNYAPGWNCNLKVGA